MEKWAEIRRRVLTGELSRRQACREYKLHWETIKKVLAHVEPPGYRKSQPRRRPKLAPFLPLIAEILEADKRAPKKQRHTAQRIFDRLVEEQAFDGCYSSVKEAVRAWRQGSQEVFLPLSHPPGEAQVDFGYADVDLAGERTQVALFVMTLPFSDAVFSCRPFRGNARRPFRKATGGLLSSSAPRRRGSATTTAAWRSPRSPAAETASSRASSCGSRATICSKRTSVSCGGPMRRGRSKA
jgi:transposase